MLRRGNPISGSFPAVGCRSTMGRVSGMGKGGNRGGTQRRSTWQLKLCREAGAVLGRLPAACLRRSKPARKGQDWESGNERWSSNLELEGFKQAEGEGQAKCLEEWWDTHGRSDLMAQGGARRRQKTQVFAVSCLWNRLDGLKHKIWIVKSESMTV